MITWAKRIFLTLILLALVASNVLSLTHTAFNAALSGLVSTALGVSTVSGALRGKVAAQNRAIARHQAAAVKRRAATRRFGTRLMSRTRRVAAESVAAIPGEAIPFLGIILLIAGTSYELYEACNSIRDLDQLYADMGMDEEIPDDVLRSVCNPALPEPATLWQHVIEKSDQWLTGLSDSG